MKLKVDTLIYSLSFSGVRVDEIGGKDFGRSAFSFKMIE